MAYPRRRHSLFPYGRCHSRHPYPLRRPQSPVLQKAFVCPDIATVQAIKFLEDANNRLVTTNALCEACTCLDYQPDDLGIRDAACLLDKGLFGCQLRGAVRVALSVGLLPSGAHGKTWVEKRTDHGKEAFEVIIQLCGPFVLASARECTIAALIHQMIHAYFLIMCGPEKPTDRKPDDRLCHNKHYWAIMYAICDIARQIDSLSFFVPEGRQVHLFNSSTIPPHCIDRLPTGSMEQFLLHESTPKWQQGRLGKALQEVHTSKANSRDCSQCVAGYDTPKREEVDAWFNKVRAASSSATSEKVCNLSDKGPEELLRSQAGSILDYVELLWDGKPIAIPRTAVDAHPSLKSKFSKPENRTLTLPGKPSLSTVLALHYFIKEKKFKSNIDVSLEPNGKPPARISEDGPADGAAAHLLNDVIIYKLASAMKFDELCKEALKRLKGRHITHTSPVSLLEEIYSAGDKGNAKAFDAPLREFAKAFLRRESGGTSNLEKLLHALPQYVTAFAELRSKLGGELEEDIQASLQVPPPSTVTLANVKPALSLGYLPPESAGGPIGSARPVPVTDVGRVISPFLELRDREFMSGIYSSLGRLLRHTATAQVSDTVDDGFVFEPPEQSLRR